MNLPTLREDNGTLALLHYSQLLNFIGFLGLIIPLILWSTKKTEIKGMDEHGKNVINFQLSLLIYNLIFFVLFAFSVFMSFFLIGFVFIAILLVLAIPLVILLIIYPIIGGIRAGNGEIYKYPMTIKFIH